MKNGLQLVKSRPKSYKIKNNHNFILGIVDDLFYIRHISLMDDYLKTRIGMLVNTPIEIN